MPTPQEIELKLGLRAGAREALEASPLLAGAEAETRHEVTTYWDTQGFDLAARGLSLRVRRRGDKRRQTVKAGGKPGLASTRGEWEWDIGTDAPDLALVHAVPELELGDLPDIQPVFTTDVQRTVRTVAVGGALIEVAIDIGEVRAGLRTLPIAEAELELKSGEVSALHHLARALCDTAPLCVVAESKAERGRRLARGAPPKWHKDHAPPLTHRASTRDALAGVIGEAVGRFLANVPAALDQDPKADSEGVHQARAAIRRLRAALRLFGRGDPVADRLRDRLKGVGAVLGEARDWDVFATDIMAERGMDGALTAPVAEHRGDSHEAVRTMLQNTALLALLLDVLIWADHAQPAGGAQRMLAAQLDREARRARKRGRHVSTRTAAELHALRRAVRRLRYDAEFVSGVFGPKAAKPYVKDCKRLQSALGDLGDAEMARRLLPRLAQGPRAEVARIGKWAEDVKMDVIRRLPRLWKRFRAADPFWK